MTGMLKNRFSMNPMSAAPVAPFVAALLAAILGMAPAAHAQLGGAVGVRIMTNVTESVRNTDRRGYEARAYYDRDLSLRLNLGLRAELSYVQMQYQRDVDTASFQVAENGFETGLYLRKELVDGWASGTYLTGGAVASFRFFCGSVGLWGPHGRVACDEGENFLPGAVLGVGYRWPANVNDFTFDIRWMQHTVAAGGGGLLSLSLGVRGRRSMDRDDDR
jgi:hypothetical protein